MGKIKLFDIRNLVLSLKAIGTSIVTGIIWAFPLFLVRFLIRSNNMLVLGFILGLASILGYMFTWGFLASKLFNIRD